MPHVPQTAIRADILQTPNICGNFSPEVTLNTIVPFDDIPNPTDFLLRQILRPRVAMDVSSPQHRAARTLANAIDVRERNLNALVIRNNDTCNAHSHRLTLVVVYDADLPCK